MTEAVEADEELDVLRAALRLRITPELLFSYARHGVQGRGGRKLAAVEYRGTIRFRTSDLDSFDAYLREPWAPAGAPRSAVPVGVRDYLRTESGGGCVRCIVGTPLEDAHIVSWEQSRSNHHHNVLRLCKNCHGLYDDGTVSRLEIDRLKDQAVNRIQARLRAVRRTGWPIAGAPSLARHLLGREEELRVAVDALRSGDSLFIFGVGGIGKTQLALRALKEAVPERPVLWISVETARGARDVVDGLLAQARTLDLDTSGALETILDEARACVVFDGVERLGADQDGVTDLLERLAGGTSDTLLVVTSQVLLPSLRPSETIKLGPLPTGAAARLLLDQEPSAPAPSEASASLLDFADGHPLTLRILAALTAHFGSPEEVLRRLEREGAAILKLPRRRVQTHLTSLSRCLELAFSQLGPLERRLLWVAICCPSGLRPNLYDLELLGIPDAIETATELRAWSLVDFQTDEFFAPESPARVVVTMLSPVRAFARLALDREPVAGMAELERDFATNVAVVIAYIESAFVRGGSPELGNALMERELPNVLAVVDLAERRAESDPAFPFVVGALAKATMMFLFTSGRFQNGLALMKTASAVADRRGSTAEAIQFLMQMQILAERARDEESASFALAEAERIGARAGGRGLAILRLAQASGAESKGDYTKAAKLASEAYDYTIGEGDRYQLAFAAFQLARALEFGGDPAEALPLYREALAIFEDEEDPINRGSALHHIGNCEAYAKRWQPALAAYAAAAAQFAELNAVEFLSNALGEAGLILPHLDTSAELPSRDLIAKGLQDIIEQMVSLVNGAEASAGLISVVFKKFGGLVSLALHSGNRDLLLPAADELSDRVLLPLESDTLDRPDWFRATIWHVQWLVRLCAFLTAELKDGEELDDDRWTVLLVLAVRAFPPVNLGEVFAWLESYLGRVHGIDVPEAQEMMRAALAADDRSTMSE